MFPVTMRVWTAGGQHVGRDVGIVYTGNTVGSILGAWLPGFLLMPLFGMQGTAAYSGADGDVHQVDDVPAVDPAEPQQRPDQQAVIDPVEAEAGPC